jgi:hypothetical protein
VQRKHLHDNSFFFFEKKAKKQKSKTQSWIRELRKQQFDQEIRNSTTMTGELRYRHTQQTTTHVVEEERTTTTATTTWTTSSLADIDYDYPVKPHKLHLQGHPPLNSLNVENNGRVVFDKARVKPSSFVFVFWPVL